MRLFHVFALLLVACDGHLRDPAENDDGYFAASELDDPLRPEGKLAFGPGPHAVRAAEYKLAPTLAPEIVADRLTESWGVVHMPDPLPAKASPVLLFVHGNHATCGSAQNPRRDLWNAYSSTGVCPAGQVVVPSHRGFDYLAERLASWGYIVVSINQNRGLTASIGPKDDPSLALARGRHVLAQLALLARWNREPGTSPQILGVDLAGKLDFSQLGLMGHSRGGEAVRVAHALYEEEGSLWPVALGAPLRLRAILEIAPVDHTDEPSFTPRGIAWGLIVPSCDADVSDLQGLDVYERAISDAETIDEQPKMAMVVWGANHNFFNSEWLEPEGKIACPVARPLFTDPKRQREAALMAVVPFFRSFVGTARTGNSAIWNSDFALAPQVNALTRLERAYEYRGDRANSIRANGLRVLSDVVATGVRLHATKKRIAALTLQPTQSAGTVTIPLDKGAREAALAFTSAAIGFRAGRPKVSRLPSEPLAMELLDDAGAVLASVPLADYVELGPGESGYLLASVRIPLGELVSDAGVIAALRLRWIKPSETPLIVSDLRFYEAGIMPEPETKRPQNTLEVALTEPSVDSYEARVVASETGMRLESAEHFGFHDAPHRLFADGALVSTARILVEEDGKHVMISGAVPEGNLELRFGESQRWIVRR